MHSLFFCFFRITSKETYFAINFMDLVAGVFFVWNSVVDDGYEANHYNPQAEAMMDVLFLVMASVAFVNYVQKNRYRSGIHMTYLIIR